MMNVKNSLGLVLMLAIGQIAGDHSIPAGSNSYNVPVSSSYSAVSSNSGPAASFYTVGSSASIPTGSSASAGSSYSLPSTSYSSSSSSVISTSYSSPSSAPASSSYSSGSSSIAAPAGSNSYSAPTSSSGGTSSYSAPASSSSSGSYSAPASSTGGSSYSAPASSTGGSSYSASAASSSSYASPAAAASSYSAAAAAPASGGSSSYGAPASTGNLYYYYYPVAAQPIEEKPVHRPAKEDSFSPVLFLLIPLVIILAAIPLLGLLGINNGRSFTGRNSELDAKFGSFDELQSEVDNLLQKYIDALDSEQCMDRVVCELGTRAQNIPSKNLFFSLVEWLAPKHLLLGKERIAIFKKAAKNPDYTLDTCKMFVCNPPKEITHPAESSALSFLDSMKTKNSTSSTPGPKEALGSSEASA